MGSWARSAAAALIAATAFAGGAGTGCRAPTQFTLELSTDLACPQGMSTGIWFGAATDAPETTSTSRCVPRAGQTPPNEIGSLLLVPSADKDATFRVEVYTAIDNRTKPEDCRAAFAKSPAAGDPSVASCIRQTRRVAFVPHTPLTLEIGMTGSCVGVACPADNTCSASTGGCIDDLVKCVGATCSVGGGGNVGTATFWDRGLVSSDGGNATVAGVVANVQGDVLIAGTTTGALDFGAKLFGRSQGTGFAVTYNPFGTLVRGAAFEFRTGGSLSHVAGVESGAVVFAGNTQGTVNGPGGISVPLPGPSGTRGIWLARSAGTEVRIAAFGGAVDTVASVGGLAAAHNPSPRIAVAGTFKVELDVPPGPPIVSASPTVEDLFLLSLDETLTPTRSTRIVSDKPGNTVQAVTLQGAGEAVVGGTFTGTLVAGAQPLPLMTVARLAKTAFAAKIDSRQGYGATGGGLGESETSAIAVDLLGDFYGKDSVVVVGHFRTPSANDSVDLRLWGPRKAAGNRDLFIVVLDSNLGILKAWSYGGDPGAEFIPTGVALANGRIHVVGLFQGSATLGTSKLTMPKPGSFLLVIDPASQGVVEVRSAGASQSPNELPRIGAHRDGSLLVAGTSRDVVDWKKGLDGDPLLLPQYGLVHAFVSKQPKGP